MGEIEELTNVIEFALLKAAANPDRIFIDDDYSEIQLESFRGGNFIVSVRRLKD